MPRTRRLAVYLFFALFGLRAQSIEVVPKRVMVDETAVIRAAGLHPAERVTIAAELVDGQDAHWTAQASFVADQQGAIDTSRQAPVKGSYKEVSAMGLVWSMTPSRHNVAQYLPPKDFGPQAIDFRLLRGNSQLASGQLDQVSIAEGVRWSPVRDGGLRGMLFLPPGNDRHPGILVLGGSEGGLPARRAAWLASHGFAALALAYFHFEDLPKDLAGIPLEYFGRALTWMAQRPEISNDHLAVTGVSRGGELALQLGSMFRGIKAVVAYVPSNVRYPACCGFTSVPWAWTWNGNPLAFAPIRGGAPSAMAVEAAIEVERTQGPLLLISGESDRVWSSSSMGDSIVSRLKRARFTYNVEYLKYPHAGHRAGRPEIVPAWIGNMRHPISGRGMEPGGSPQGNIESSLDAIPKVISFLQQSLSSN